MRTRRQGTHDRENSANTALAVFVTLTLVAVALPAVVAAPPASTSTPTADVWLPEDKLTATSQPGANTGSDVAIEGDTAVVGVPGEDRAVIYERVDSTVDGWNQMAELVPPEDVDPGEFGGTVAMDEDASSIAVGARESSQIFVYEKQDSGWAFVETLTVDGAICAGHALAMEEGVIVTGSPCPPTSAHVFERGGDGEWYEVEELAGGGPGFGFSVAIDGDRAAVGMLGDKVEIYERVPGEGWQRTAQATPGSRPTVVFAYSIDLEDGRLAVGDLAARENPAETGAAYVYEPIEDGGDAEEGVWQLQDTLLPSDVNPAEVPGRTWFGFSVGVEGDRVVVGAVGAGSLPGLPRQPVADQRDQLCISEPQLPTCHKPGAAYVFAPAADGWKQTAKVTAPDAKPGSPVAVVGLWNGWPSAFGSSVSLGDGVLAVGAPLADATPGDDAGAAYVFDRYEEGTLE